MTPTQIQLVAYEICLSAMAISSIAADLECDAFSGAAEKEAALTSLHSLAAKTGLLVTGWAARQGVDPADLPLSGDPMRWAVYPAVGKF